jgi:hypothetical protein
MAKVLSYNLQQLDVLEGGYYPQGFADIELEQQSVRRALIQVLSGNRPLIVSPAAPTLPAPFPPPPAPSGSEPYFRKGSTPAIENSEANLRKGWEAAIRSSRLNDASAPVGGFRNGL